MFCTACGKAIPDDARVCSYCGRPVAGAAASGAASAKPDLVRPRQGRRIAGVCLGVANRFGWNVTVLRLIWALCFFFAGGGLLLYVVLWIVMPSE